MKYFIAFLLLLVAFPVNAYVLERKTAYSGGGSGYSAMDTVQASAIIDLDGSVSDSYTSGQTVSDLTANGYDFYLGSTSGVDADDPTFSSPNFSNGFLTSASTPTAMGIEDLANTTGGDFYLWFVLTTPATLTLNGWWTLNDGTLARWGVFAFDSGPMRLQRRNTNTDSFTTSTTTFGTSTRYCVVVSYDYSANEADFYVDSTTAETIAGTSPPDTTNTMTTFNFMKSIIAGNDPNMQFEAMGMGLAELTSTEVGNIFTELDTRDATRGCNP